jgi:hypothetical protein
MSLSKLIILTIFLLRIFSGLLRFRLLQFWAVILRLGNFELPEKTCSESTLSIVSVHGVIICYLICVQNFVTDRDRVVVVEPAFVSPAADLERH